MLKTLKSCLHINHFLKYKNTANNYKLVNWGRVRKLGSIDTSCRMWCLALKCHRILDLISYSGDVFLSYPIQHVHVHYRSGRNWIMKKKMTDMKSCFTSLDCVTCCSNDCFLTLEKEEEERGRACYFVGNSKLKTYKNCYHQVHNTTHVSEHPYRNRTCSSHWIYQSAKDRNYQNFKHFCVDVYSIDHSLNRAFQGQNEQIGLKHWNTETQKWKIC